VPSAAPPAIAPPQIGSDAAPELPKTHQMIDSAPPALPTPLAAPATTDAAATAQMHVGLRTDAFGSVEIHTVVQQSQIGITVHSDREIAIVQFRGSRPRIGPQQKPPQPHRR